MVVAEAWPTLAMKRQRKIQEASMCSKDDRHHGVSEACSLPVQMHGMIDRWLALHLFQPAWLMRRWNIGKLMQTVSVFSSEVQKERIASAAGSTTLLQCPTLPIDL